MKKMMSSSSSSSSSSYLFGLLHEDIIIDEILLKLPLDSLLSLRCVSRYFHSLITSPSLLLQLPVSSLLRLRCIPNYFHSLITSPSFIKKHLHLHHNSAAAAQVLHHDDHSLLLISSLCSRRRHETFCVFHHYTFNFSTSSTDDPTRPQVIEIMHCPFESTGGIQASCNGLLFLDNCMRMNKDGGPAGYIWNPCNPKEYKEVLPPPPPSSRLIQQQQQKTEYDHLFEGIQVCLYRCFSGFCGFGYDSINEEYKILYYENRVGHLPDEVSRFDDDLVSITEFKLYKLGTNTWTSICSDSPIRSLFFGHLWRTMGVTVNGALHWIMTSSHRYSSSCCCAKKAKFIKENSCCAKNAKIISFDMKKEEFGEIQKPHYYKEDEQQCYSRYGGLQVLLGCLCVCEFPPPDFNTTDIWMLKDYAVKDSWTKLFTIVLSNDPWAARAFRVLRLCENGEIVMTEGFDMIVYDPVKHISRRVENLDKTLKKTWRYEVFYTESLVSLS